MASYRADSPDRSRQRRQFLDELKAQIPIHPTTESTAEVMARIGGEQAACELRFVAGNQWEDATIRAAAIEATREGSTPTASPAATASPATSHPVKSAN